MIRSKSNSGYIYSKTLPTRTIVYAVWQKYIGIIQAKNYISKTPIVIFLQELVYNLISKANICKNDQQTILVSITNLALIFFPRDICMFIFLVSATL